MKKIFYALLFLGTTTLWAQENITYQKPPKEILELADYERAPSVNMDSQKRVHAFVLPKYFQNIRRFEPRRNAFGWIFESTLLTNISSTVTYITNLKVRKSCR
jgi:hypothetical protein